MSVLFTYADQQRAAQSSQAEVATTGINNPAIIADQGIANLRYIAGQQFGGQNLILRKNVTADSWKALEGRTIGVVPGTYARVLFLVAAQEGGADLEKIKIVNVSVGATALEALRKGDLELRAVRAHDRPSRGRRDRILSAQAGYRRLLFGSGQRRHLGQH
jgi:ABC-type nitrate/sulfonate/bicarbonate transport system substrate-binding protein